MKIKAFITHKKAEHYSNCQDRFCISKDGLIIALSDGMTSNTLYPEIWAGLLTESYVKSKGKWDDEILSLCRQDWDKAVHDKLEERKAKGDRNVWRLENSIAMKQSAGATLCGICIDGNARWIGHVIGDSTIIECKNNKIERICTSEDKPFDNYPDYLDSISKGRGEIKEFNGSIDENSFLLLVSDPFSEFFDKQKENSTKYLEEILSLDSHEDFLKLVEDWRLQGMHNDDSTLIIIQYSKENDVKQDDIEDLIKKEKEGVNSTPINVIEPSEEKLHVVEETEKKMKEESLSNVPTCPIDDVLNKFVDMICAVFGKINKKKKGIIKAKIKELLDKLLKEYDNTSRSS